jgi:hypothetical protein
LISSVEIKSFKKMSYRKINMIAVIGMILISKVVEGQLVPPGFDGPDGFDSKKEV